MLRTVLILVSFTLIVFPSIVSAEFEPNNYYGEANLLPDTMTGQLMSTSDEDWYYVEVGERGNLHISFTGVNPFLDSYFSIVVYDEELTTLAIYYKDSVDFTVGLPQSGKYYLRIIDGQNHTTTQYTIAKLFEPENYISPLQGLYRVDRYVENYNDGSSYDTDDFTDLTGTVVFLPGEFIGTFSFNVGGSRYYIAEHASYTENDSSISLHSHIFETDKSATYSWDDLKLTISGMMVLSSGPATFAYHLTKLNNMVIMGATEEEINWDINRNHRIDLPDIVNGLRVLSGQ